MSDFLPKVPFLRLLLPLVAGVLIQYYFYIHPWIFPVLFAGLFIILLSYLIPGNKEYRYRWLFGTGVYLFLFSAGVLSTTIRQAGSTFDYTEEKCGYSGTITDIPQTKPRSVAIEVKLENSGKKIICYLEEGIRSSRLKTGDKISFYGQIKRFTNFTNPDDFNYPRYMFNKGYSGSVYLSSDNWEKVGESPFSFKISASKYRQKILNFYNSLGLNHDEYSVLSALTLGYKDLLTDDTIQSFRATGTAHVLAVSGMHVGIIYGIILSVFSLFSRQAVRNSYIRFTIILLLWVYAFITGLSPSIIRATIMITLFILATISGRKGFSYNTIFLAAFFMLLFNPLYLFDAGFQLSFAAVLSIRVLQPKLFVILKPENKFIKGIWALFTLCVAAQLGTFPICLYYYGTFPVYFFITNLLIIPLVTVQFYTAIFIVFIAGTGIFLPGYITSFILNVTVFLLKQEISWMTGVNGFFENMPGAVIEIQKPSLVATTFIVFIVWTGIYTIINRQKKNYKLFLSLLLLSLLIIQLNIFKMQKNTLSIFCNNNKSKIELRAGSYFYSVDSLTHNNLVTLQNKKLLSVTDDRWKNMAGKSKYKIDYIHIFENDSISLYSLTRIFSIENVILDGSLSTKKKKDLIQECENMGLAYFDIAKNGMFRIFF